MTKILSIGYQIESNNVTNINFEGKETLLDSDIVIINVESVNSTLAGNYPTFDRRKKEISTLRENKKMVVIFPSEFHQRELLSNSSDEKFHVSNYSFLPKARFTSLLEKNLKVGVGKADSLKLMTQNSIFSSYFLAFKKELNYDIYIDLPIDNVKEKDRHTFIVNKSNKIIGFSTGLSDGIIAFLPPPKYNKENNKLVDILFECYKKFIGQTEKTPPPDWIGKYTLVGEEAKEQKIVKLQKQIENLEREKKDVIIEKEELTEYKNLLYEKGKPLENIVLKSFRILGFQAENRAEGDIEHDIVFSAEEGRGIAEVEGKDKAAISIDKFDQLNRVVDEDFEKTNIYPTGVLIGNHYRLTKPDERGEPFTEKVHIVAKKKSFGLLTTYELFKAVQYILKNPEDETFKKKCRTKILSGTGKEVKFFDD